MKRTIVIITMFVVQLPQLFAGNTTDTLASQKDYFNQAKAEIEQMLSGTKPLDYERAVFVTENAYLGNTISYELYQGIISFHVNNVKHLAEANRTPQVFKATLLETEAQQRENYEKLLYNWAIYTYFTDTTALMYNNDGKNSVYFHLPFAYPTNDPMATLDWSNSQTINLLDDKAANCNAQVALYKILSDRLKTDAKIGTAPSHAYITHTDTKGTTYNVELPTRSFPGAGAIMTVTYTPISAVSSGISMRSLTPSQSVALCLVYLAKGYEHKFGKADKSFPMNCSETALRYDSLCLNAMLLKAEILEEKVTATHKTVTQLQTDNDFIAYQKIVGTLYKKGYREMPLDMKNLIVSHLKQDSANFFLQNRTPQGFQTIKPKDDRYATLSWGKYDEVHEPKRFEQYGRAIFDTKTMKISKLVTADSLYNNYPFDPVIAAWQIDPLASKYPSISPYSAFANNPIRYIDKNGEEPIDPRTGKPFTMNLYRAAVFNPYPTDGKALKIVKDEDLYNNASPWFMRERNAPDAQWDGASYHKHESVWEHTSSGATSSLGKLTGVQGGGDYGAPNDAMWRQVASSGSYTFVDDKYAESEWTFSNLLSYNIITVKENYISQIVNLSRPDDNSQFNISSVTTFDIKKGDVQSRNVSTWWGGTRTEKYRTLSVTETTQNYQNNKASGSATSKTYQKEEIVK